MKKLHIRYVPRAWRVTLCFSAGFALSVIATEPTGKSAVEDPCKAGLNAVAVNDNTSKEDKARKERSKAAFKEAYKVFMHPRCMNCHPNGDIPLQGDDSHLHTMGVRRGIDGKGLYALKCKNCHQDENLEGEHLPPGNSNWHLPTAARPMVFEGKSPRELAMHFKDTSFTGFKNIEHLIEHVENDHLVQHSFTYGTRPPLSHKAFVEKVKEWVNNGAELPDK
jgi:hypothetical protein